MRYTPNALTLIADKNITEAQAVLFKSIAAIINLFEACFPSITNDTELLKYVDKCLSIKRHFKFPRIFLCSSETDFNNLITQIKTWEVAKNQLILSTIQNVNLQDKAIRDTFFFYEDEDEKPVYFNPSEYHVLINPNTDLVKSIEERASRADETRALKFDEPSFTNTLPSADDPFKLTEIDLNSTEYVLVGDSIMYAYMNEKEEIIIKLFAIKFL